jgi:DNA-binding response OmpR family regulator
VRPFTAVHAVALAVAAEPAARVELRRHLREAGYVVVVAPDVQVVCAILAGIAFDLIVVHGGAPLVAQVRSVLDGKAPLLSLDGPIDGAHLQTLLPRVDGN